MGKNDVIDYNFKAVTWEEFEVSLDMKAEGKMLKMLFQKARHKLKRKKGIDTDGNPDVIQAFDIPPQYLNAVQTIIRPVMSHIRKDVNKDSIEILSWDIAKGKFIRQGSGDWQINLIVKGMYSDRR